MSVEETVDITPVVQRLVTRSLEVDDYESVFEDLCNGLKEVGLPLLRVHLTMETLHPLVASVDLTWLRGRGLVVNRRVYSRTPSEQWLQSPLYWMLSQNRLKLRHRLNEEKALRRFPVLAEFREMGATDYWACLTPFGDFDSALRRRDGIITSWLSDDPDGFSDHHLEALSSLQAYVGLVAKLSKHDHTARNVVAAYLGQDAGRRVLEGQIRLGDVDHIPAVIWLSDLRDSTASAERVPPATFLDSLNEHFECTAGAVLEHDGEVLRFIGDAVLAVFPISSDASPTAAATRALAASRTARRRTEVLNARRVERGEQPLAYGLGLHLGELLYGNIGVPSRVEFSVIGQAANEVSRLESLTKELGETVLVSRAFTEAVELPWVSLGAHRVKGVGSSMEVFAPPEPESDDG